MIEFRGYISGAAEKHFHNKARDFGQYILLAILIVFLPSIMYIAFRTKNWLMLGLYCTLFVILPLLTHIPQSKKGKKSIIPKRIYTDEDSIVCVSEKYIEHRLISDVKQVRDFGEFYEIIFPFGKISDKFICQKNLLAIGTVEEFEKLFDGKIVRKIHKTEDGSAS